MSHVATIDMEIKSLETLEAACKNLGLELVRDQKTYRWWGHSVGDYPIPQGFTAAELGKCEHAIRIPNNNEAYEIGVVPRRDGRPGYTLLWDFYAGGRGMQAKVGNNGDKLKQQYAAQHTVSYWRRKGLRVSTTTNERGQVVVKASK